MPEVEKITFSRVSRNFEEKYCSGENIVEKLSQNFDEKFVKSRHEANFGKVSNCEATKLADTPFDSTSFSGRRLRSGFVCFPRSSSSSSSSSLLGPEFSPTFSKTFDNKILGPCCMHRENKSRCVTCKNMKFSQKKFRSNVTHKPTM